jgi:hypothetical protein
LRKLDFVVGIVVFLMAWAALARSFSGDAWGAAAVAFFAGAMATWWWRYLLLLAVVGIAVLAYFHSR